MNLPRYAIVGNRPVKAVATADGGVDVLAYDWDSGDFVRELSYLPRLLTADTEVLEVSEEEFNRHVAGLKQQPRQS